MLNLGNWGRSCESFGAVGASPVRADQAKVGAHQVRCCFGKNLCHSLGEHTWPRVCPHLRPDSKSTESDSEELSFQTPRGRQVKRC